VAQVRPPSVASPLDSTRSLRDRAAWRFNVFAPAVLEAGGDPGREEAALARPGVRSAFYEYHDLLSELQRREAESSVKAFRNVRAAAARIDAALERANLSTC